MEKESNRCLDVDITGKDTSKSLVVVAPSFFEDTIYFRILSDLESGEFVETAESDGTYSIEYIVRQIKEKYHYNIPFLIQSRYNKSTARLLGLGANVVDPDKYLALMEDE